MKGICSIMLLISISAAFAGDLTSKAVIWYDGLSFYKPLNRTKEPTVFFQKWDRSILEFLDDKDYRVALQLDHSLDPNPEDQHVLFGLTTLSSIEEESLISDYLSFLEDYGRSNNLDYLVLPDTIGLNYLEKRVLRMANERAPNYFIENSLTSKEIPQSKRDLTSTAPLIWIVNQSVNAAKLSRWSKKMPHDFYKSFIKEARKKKAISNSLDLYDRLVKDISQKGVVAIDFHEQLPISSEAVIYFGSDDQLRQRLAQYVEVYDRPQSVDYPVILDRRAGYEGKIFGNEIIIDFNTASLEENATGLLLPSEHEQDDIFLAKMLFGAQEIVGKSTIPGSRMIQKKGFIGYADPHYEGLDESQLVQLEQYVDEAIKSYATPGSQLSVIKNGSIVLEKSYGHFTYDSLKKLSNADIFDLASITKVVATLPAIALLIDQGKVSLEDSLALHLDDFRDSNKSHVTIKQLLAHNGGIRSYIPFWRRAMSGDRLDAFYYKSKEDQERDIRSYGLEPHPALKDSLKNWIQKSDLIKNQDKYNYSDLGYMILHMVVESVSGQPFDEFLDENFYQPMELDMTFNPRKKGFDLAHIVPTEFDERYRREQVWGEVHDRNAHAFGGVAGHAGLFSNSSDLAKMMFMMSNGGFYNGKQYLKKETLDTFNFRYFQNNRRGLGWDKKDGIRDSASALASDSSYGHTGFTGTMVWADPENDLIFVFLSNRIYPDANNSKLMELNTRSEIHDVIYQSILND